MEQQSPVIEIMHVYVAAVPLRATKKDMSGSSPLLLTLSQSLESFCPSWDLHKSILLKEKERLFCIDVGNDEHRGRWNFNNKRFIKQIFSVREAEHGGFRVVGFCCEEENGIFVNIFWAETGEEKYGLWVNSVKASRIGFGFCGSACCDRASSGRFKLKLLQNQFLCLSSW
nr:PREDICTED: uncharacterized protein LOC101296113 isoform X2 [Fragaria vesca subsp. vesca]